MTSPWVSGKAGHRGAECAEHLALFKRCLGLHGGVLVDDGVTERDTVVGALVVEIEKH